MTRPMAFSALRCYFWPRAALEKRPIFRKRTIRLMLPSSRPERDCSSKRDSLNISRRT
jgi:hypothetical protein